MKKTKWTTHFLILFLSLILSCSPLCFALTETQYSDYQNASKTIGKWLVKSSSHYDFYSATPIATRQPGIKFMIAGAPPTQYASDYGVSVMRAPLDQKVIAAYEVIGTPASALPQYLELNRFHVGLGLGNNDDVTASFVTTQDMSLTGWGVGYKTVLVHNGPFFFSYRAQYSQASRDNFFTTQSLTNDFSCSLYFLLFDIYGGVRHTAGIINFSAPSPQLALPEIKYFSNLNELEYFYGASLALSTKLRLTLQANKVSDDYSIAAKISFHFNSLLPERGDVLRDPRYLRR